MAYDVQKLAEAALVHKKSILALLAECNVDINPDSTLEQQVEDARTDLRFKMILLGTYLEAHTVCWERIDSVENEKQ